MFQPNKPNSSWLLSVHCCETTLQLNAYRKAPKNQISIWSHRLGKATTNMNGKLESQQAKQHQQHPQPKAFLLVNSKLAQPSVSWKLPQLIVPWPMCSFYSDSARLRSTRKPSILWHHLPQHKEEHITEQTTSSWQSAIMMVAQCLWTLCIAVQTPDLPSENQFSPKVFTLLSAQRHCPLLPVPWLPSRWSIYFSRLAAVWLVFALPVWTQNKFCGFKHFLLNHIWHKGCAGSRLGLRNPNPHIIIFAC